MSIPVKTHRDHGNSDKGKHFIGTTYSFRGLVHYCHGEKHGGMQAEMVLEKELSILHFDLQVAEEDCVPHWA